MPYQKKCWKDLSLPWAASPNAAGLFGFDFLRRNYNQSAERGGNQRSRLQCEFFLSDIFVFSFGVLQSTGYWNYKYVLLFF